MLQDELARLTLTELDKRDERQDVERVCECQVSYYSIFLQGRNVGENLETERTVVPPTPWFSASCLNWLPPGTSEVTVEMQATTAVVICLENSFDPYTFKIA